MLWAVDNWVSWCHCCWLSLIFHFDCLGGVFPLFLCLTDRRGELFRMPAQVIKYAWLPVLRLKLTSILMIRNPHELLRKSWGGGGSSCLGLSWEPEKIHRNVATAAWCRSFAGSASQPLHSVLQRSSVHVTSSQKSPSFPSDLHHNNSWTHIMIIYSNCMFAQAVENGASCLASPNQTHNPALTL